MPKQYRRPKNLSETLNLSLALGLKRRKRCRVFAEKWAKDHPSFGLSESDVARIAIVAMAPLSLVEGRASELHAEGVIELLAYNPDGFVSLFTAVRRAVASYERTTRAKIERAAARCFLRNDESCPLDTVLIRSELKAAASPREVQKIAKTIESTLLRVGSPPAQRQARKHAGSVATSRCGAEVGKTSLRKHK